MPKIGMEPIRREALVNAAIDEIGRIGSLDVTVAQIARKAGVSSALAHHYFGSKEQILLAAMRRILVVFGAEAREGLAVARTPRQRLDAIATACFTPVNFRPEVASAWLNLYVLAHTSDEAKRLLAIYHKRLHSNLVHALRPLAGDNASAIATSVGALIDGIYLRQVLSTNPFDQGRAEKMVTDHLDVALSIPLPPR